VEEMGGICSMRSTEEKCMQYSGRKTSRKEAILKNIDVDGGYLFKRTFKK
jgi:hypothetical protein